MSRGALSYSPNINSTGASVNTEMSLLTWSVGLAVSVVVGGFVTWGFLEALRWYTRAPKSTLDLATRAVPSWLTGTIERLFFSLAMAFGLPGTTIAMIAWIAAKMAADWNRPALDKSSTPEEAAQRVLGSVTALLAGLVSMIFAIIGGLICNGRIPVAWPVPLS